MKSPALIPLITDLISLAPHNSIYSQVEVIDRKALERIAKNKDEDEIYEKFRETAQTLINDHWESFANAEHFKKLLDGKSTTLSIHSVLKPSVLEWFWVRHYGGSKLYGLHDLSAMEPTRS